MKKFFLTGILLLASIGIFAQTFQIKGKVVQSLTEEPVELATAALLRPDSVLVTGMTTQADGSFRLKTKAAGHYLLKVSFMGYKTLFRDIKLDQRHRLVEVGNIALETNDQLLKAAVVETTLAQMEQKGDTTVFNAGAYTVPKGSNLEALVKQLPGVEVKDDGSITWNGKTIKELLVDGKDFFKGDKDVAMKNLPSDLVSKIKTYDKASKYTEQTGIDDGEEQTVIDISTKKELNQTWMGNLDLAYGSHDRYATSWFGTRITDHTRISTYGDFNNTGGQRYSSMTWSVPGETTYKDGGADFFWENGKKDKEAGRLELGGSFNVSKQESSQMTTSASETFLTAGSNSSFSNSESRNASSSFNIRANFKLEWNPDSMTNIYFRPNFSHNNNDNHSNSRTATFNQDPYDLSGMEQPLDSIFLPVVPEALGRITVNRNEHAALGDGRADNVSGTLSILRRLNDKGRNISFRSNAGYNKSEHHNFSMSQIRYFKDGKSSFLNQYSHTPSVRWNYDFRLGYAHPFAKYWVAEARYTYAFQYSDSDRSRYNLDRLDSLTWGNPLLHPALGRLPSTADSLAAVRDLMNSQYATYKEYDHKVNLSLRFKNEKIRANVGVELNPERTKMAYNQPRQRIDTVITRDLLQLSPDVRFRYRFSKTKSLDFRYHGRSSAPSMTNLLAVVDNSNPLSVTMGNPGLKPSWTNDMSVDYNGYDYKSQRGCGFGARYSQTYKQVSQLLVYDESAGVRYTRPENIDGNWRTSGYAMFNFPLDKAKHLTCSSYTNISYNHAVGYVSSFVGEGAVGPQGDAQDATDYDPIFANAEVQKNTTHDLGLSEYLKLNYRKKWLSVGAKGNVYYNHSRSSLQDRNNMDVWSFTYGGYLDLNFDFGLSVSSSISMRSRRGYSASSMNTNELLWGAQLSQSFLKKKNATVSLQFYDILQRQSNVNHYVNAMQRNDTWTNGIHSYCMLHLIYKLNIFPGGK